jgi:hypothetical protein
VHDVNKFAQTELDLVSVFGDGADDPVNDAEHDASDAEDAAGDPDDADEDEEDAADPDDLDAPRAMETDDAAGPSCSEPPDEQDDVVEGDDDAPAEAARPQQFFAACFKMPAGRGDKKGKAPAAGLSATFTCPKATKSTSKRKIVKRAVPKSSPLFKDVRVYDRCIRCAETIPDERGFICAACEAEDAQLRARAYTTQLGKVRALEEEHHHRWNKCYACRDRHVPAEDSSECEITNCINYVCPNWARRQVVTRALHAQSAKLSKIGLERN